jgi:hypothetical protein
LANYRLSPLGRQFSLDCSSKIAEVVQIFLATFFREKSYVSMIAKNHTGYLKGDFFTKSSGHLDSSLHRYKLAKKTPIVIILQKAILSNVQWANFFANL